MIDRSNLSLEALAEEVYHDPLIRYLANLWWAGRRVLRAVEADFPSALLKMRPILSAQKREALQGLLLTLFAQKEADSPDGDLAAVLERLAAKLKIESQRKLDAAYKERCRPDPAVRRSAARRNRVLLVNGGHVFTVTKRQPVCYFGDEMEVVEAIHRVVQLACEQPASEGSVHTLHLVEREGPEQPEWTQIGPHSVTRLYVPHWDGLLTHKHYMNLKLNRLERDLGVFFDLVVVENAGHFPCTDVRPRDKVCSNYLERAARVAWLLGRWCRGHAAGLVLGVKRTQQSVNAATTRWLHDNCVYYELSREDGTIWFRNLAGQTEGKHEGTILRSAV